MSQARPVIGFKGVKSSGNPLAFPPGSLARALNCMMTSRDVVQPRRGQKLDGTRYIDGQAFDPDDNRASELFQWGEHLVVHYEGDDGGYLSILEDFLTGTTATQVGAAERPYPELLRMKFADMVRSLYFTTDVGVQTLDTPDATPRIAGIPRPGDFVTIETAAAGTRLIGDPNATGSYLSVDSAVGFRATIGHLDENGVVRESDACGRILVRNPADVVVTAGNLVRATNVMTATVDSGHNFRVGDVFSVLPGDVGGGADLAAGNYTVTGVTSTTIVFASNGTDGAIAGDQTFSMGTKKVQVVFTIPPDLSTAYFVRLYRTVESEGADIDPENEHYLCIERRLTSSEVTNRVITLTDTTPSDFLGQDLYLNPNGGDGPLSENTRPPHAADVCRFDGRMFYFDTYDRHRLFLRLLGCGSPDGLQTNDRLAIGDRFYVFDNVSLFTFTDRTPSRNIADTLTSFMNNYDGSLALDSSSDPQSMAHVITDGDTPTGQLLFENLALDGSALHAATTRQSAFQDPLPLLVAVLDASSERDTDVVTITTATAHGFVAGQQVRLCSLWEEAPDPNFAPGIKTIATVPTTTTFTYAEVGADATMGTDYAVYPLDYASDDYAKPCRFSKQGEPEACPLGYNIDDRLPPGAEVLRGRASPQNDRLYLFLAGGDIYEVSGSAPYTVRRFDGTAELLAADSLQEHAGKLYGLTSQGVVAVDDAGVGLVGGDLEEELRKLLALMDIDEVSLGNIFALSYESERQYQLWLPLVDPDDEEELADFGVVQQALLLNSMAGQWMGPWLVKRTCGLVFRRAGGTGLLVLGDGEHNRLRIERKTYTFRDFADEDTACTVGEDEIADGVIDISTDLAFMGDGAGWVCEAPAGSGAYFRVTAVTLDPVDPFMLEGDPWPGTITIDITGGAPVLTEAQTVTVFRPYDVALKWSPDSGGQPGMEKHWRSLQLHFKEYLVDELVAAFSAEKVDTEKAVTIGNRAFAMGEPLRRVLVKRADVPKGISRASSLTVELQLAEAFSYFQILGYSTSAESASERSGA